MIRSTKPINIEDLPLKALVKLIEGWPAISFSSLHLLLFSG